MKKQVAFALAAALSLSVAGTALPVSAANPFVDVPANHWAYDAVDQLSKDGVITGYGDGSFRGDRTLTRYEMAAMIAKITNVEDKNSALVKRLQAEFGNELYNMGVRVDALEKNASTIKFTGDARIRYQQGSYVASAVGYDTLKKSTRMQERVRINMTADVNDNVKFIGRLLVENNSNKRHINSHATSNPTVKTSEDESMILDRAEFAWTSGNVGLSAGRLVPKLGQGYIWDGGRADGVLAKYNNGKFSLATGYLDLKSEFNKSGSVNSKNVYVADLGYQFHEKAGLTATYLKAVNLNNWASSDAPGTPNGTTASQKINPNGSFNLQNGDGIEIWGVGGNIKLGKDLRLIGEYMKNEDANSQNEGARAKIQYGTVNMNKPGSGQYFVEYLRYGGNAVLGSGTGTGYVASNSSAIFGDGIRGWGVGATYVLAKNVNMEATYHFNLETMDKRDLNNAFTVATNFRF